MNRKDEKRQKELILKKKADSNKPRKKKAQHKMKIAIGQRVSEKKTTCGTRRTTTKRAIWNSHLEYQ